ncbi:MAG: hypothetical protein QOE35_892 [Actinomycetota bacterium]|jgi:hypothetical protein
MRNALQRAWKLVAAVVVVCAFVPAGKADGAVTCGYVRVLTSTVPLLTLCGPADCSGLQVTVPPLGPTEAFVCVMV